MFLHVALLTSLLCPGPYGQTQTEQKATYVRARILVRLEDAEFAGLQQFLKELRRTVPQYRRFHAQVHNLQRSPLGAAAREGFDLCLGLYESEILDLESRLALLGGRSWIVQGGECYGLVKNGRVLPLDGRVPQEVYVPDPIAVRRFAAALAAWRKALGPLSFEALRAARVPELLPETGTIRETLRRYPTKTGFLRLDAGQVVGSQKQILLLLCAGLSKEARLDRAKETLLLDLLDRLNQPRTLARIYLRQGYLSAGRALELDRVATPLAIEVDEARDLWLRGPLPQIMNPRGEEAEILTTILLLIFGGSVLVLVFRSFRSR